MQLKLAFVLPIADIVIFGLIALFIYKGFRRGALKELFSVLRIYFSFVITAVFYEKLASLLLQVIGIPPWLAQMICFAVIFLVLLIIMWAIRVILHYIIRSRPAKSATLAKPSRSGWSKIGGIVLGLLEGILLVSIFIMCIDFYPARDGSQSLFKNTISYKVVGQVAPSIKDFTIRNTFRLKGTPRETMENPVNE